MHNNFKGKSNKYENWPKKLFGMGWIANYHESSFAKLKSIMAFKWSKVNNGCDKPCASFTSLDRHDMNGIRWVILAYGLSSHTWIARQNCNTVCGRGVTWPYLAIREVSRWCLKGYRTGCMLTRAVYGSAFDLGKSCVRQIENGKGAVLLKCQPIALGDLRLST